MMRHYEADFVGAFRPGDSANHDSYASDPVLDDVVTSKVLCGYRSVMNNKSGISVHNSTAHSPGFHDCERRRCSNVIFLHTKKDAASTSPYPYQENGRQDALKQRRPHTLSTKTQFYNKSPKPDLDVGYTVVQKCHEIPTGNFLENFPMPSKASILETISAITLGFASGTLLCFGGRLYLRRNQIAKAKKEYERQKAHEQEVQAEIDRVRAEKKGPLDKKKGGKKKYFGPGSPEKMAGKKSDYDFLMLDSSKKGGSDKSKGKPDMMKGKDKKGSGSDSDGKKGEFSRKKGDFDGKKGESSGKKGDFSGKKGDFDGKKGESSGKKGDFDGKKGEFSGKKGEFDGKKSEGKKAEISAKKALSAFDKELSSLGKSDGKKSPGKKN